VHARVFLISQLRRDSVTGNKDAFSLYVPTPVDVWLKRSATFSSYKFIRNRVQRAVAAAAVAAAAALGARFRSHCYAAARRRQMEVELREVPIVSAPSSSKQRRTMTLDLAANKPMTVRLIYRAGGGAPASPRSDGEAAASGDAKNCASRATSRRRGVARLSCALMRSQRARRAAGNFQFDDGTQPETRVMVFRRSDLVDLAVAHACHEFKLAKCG
jgi:hypothetical protein